MLKGSKAKISKAKVTNLIQNYNSYLICNNLIKKSEIRPIKQTTKNLICSLLNNPDNFNFEERFYTFKNKRSGNDVLASYVLAILKASDETALYLEMQEKTY